MNIKGMKKSSDVLITCMFLFSQMLNKKYAVDKETHGSCNEKILKRHVINQKEKRIRESMKSRYLTKLN